MPDQRKGAIRGRSGRSRPHGTIPGRTGNGDRKEKNECPAPATQQRCTVGSFELARENPSKRKEPEGDNVNAATAARSPGTAHSPHVAWTPHPPPPPPPSFQVRSLPHAPGGCTEPLNAHGRAQPGEILREKNKHGETKSRGAPSTSDRNTRAASSSGQAGSRGSKGTRESPAGTKSSSLTSSQGPGARKVQREAHRAPLSPHQHVHHKTKSGGSGRV